MYVHVCTPYEYIILLLLLQVGIVFSTFKIIMAKEDVEKTRSQLL